MDHAENIRHFEVVNIPHWKDGFEEIRRVAKYWKSRSRITCMDYWNLTELHEEWWITILDCDRQVCEQIRRRASWRERRICSLPRGGGRTYILHLVSRDCEGAPKWTNLEWVDLLHRGNVKKRFQYCLNSDGFIHYMRVSRDHSGGNKVDPLLPDKVQMPYMWSEYLHHVGSSLCLQSIIHSGLIVGWKDLKEGRQTVFFTAVDPMSDSQEEVITTCQSQERYSTRPSGKCSRMHHAGSIWEKLKIQDGNSGKLDPIPLSFMTLCQPTVLKKWQIPKLKRFCIRKFHYLHVQHLK